jgi:hypothetical protein
VRKTQIEGDRERQKKTECRLRKKEKEEYARDTNRKVGERHRDFKLRKRSRERRDNKQ